MTFRRNWGEDRVYFQDDKEKLVSVPTAWASVSAPDSFVRVIRGRSQKDLPRPDTDEREAVCEPRAQRRDHALGKEIARDERVHMGPDGLLPSGLSGSPPLRQTDRFATHFISRSPYAARASSIHA